MDIRAVTGYIAHVLLASYWVWVISCTTPQLRKGARNRDIAARAALLKTAGIVLTALLVGVIHFWATAVWQVPVAILTAVAIAIPLRRRYRMLVAAPRHRLTMGARAREFEQRHGRRWVAPEQRPGPPRLAPEQRHGPPPRFAPEQVPAREIIRSDAWTPKRVRHPHRT